MGIFYVRKSFQKEKLDSLSENMAKKKAEIL